MNKRRRFAAKRRRAAARTRQQRVSVFCQEHARLFFGAHTQLDRLLFEVTTAVYDGSVIPRLQRVDP